MHNISCCFELICWENKWNLSHAPDSYSNRVLYNHQATPESFPLLDRSKLKPRKYLVWGKVIHFDGILILRIVLFESIMLTRWSVFCSVLASAFHADFFIFFVPLISLKCKIKQFPLWCKRDGSCILVLGWISDLRLIICFSVALYRRRIHVCFLMKHRMRLFFY